MDIVRAKKYVLDTVRAYMQTDEDGMRLVDPRVQRPLFLVGPPGIGKTAIMAQVASELGIGLVSYSMTHHTRQSALGLPVIEHHDYKGYGFDASEYTMSEIIASIYEYMAKTGLEQGILFLDEVNCVSETLYPSMLQFLQFKTFGKHSVPDGWIIACAGNPPEYNRSVHEFDIATLDRIRKIEVEPDIDAWKAYAAEAGVHPAITTFLETEKDYFYRIESTPGGKSFVTARGWEDLSRMIMLNERIGEPVEQDLIAQFVQDEEIAEKFSLYYDLFCKYQSDYQIPAILEGVWPEELAQRAAEAPFDERLALLGLLLDAVVPQAGDVLLDEEVLTEVRDALRTVKPALIERGENAVAVLDPLVAECGQRLRRLAEAGTGETTAMRRTKRVQAIYKECANACTQAREEAGEAAFEVIHQEFRGHVGSLEADVASVRSQLENAYGFLEQAFGDGRETLLFTTELTARRQTTLFISRYGCDAFVRHNQQLQTTERRSDLLERIDAVKDEEAALAEAASAGAAGAGAAGAASSGISGSSAPAVPGAVATSASEKELAAYYRDACWEFGYASLCHMSLPAGLEGKTVLDVGCRRGKGVFKVSDRVGSHGRAIGVDWVESHIAEAKSRMDRAWRETGLAANNMEFHQAYPEDLMGTGLGDGTVDVAFVNSVLHLMYEPKAALSEIARVLKPGGLLVCEVAVASAPRDTTVVAEARKLGNSIQAAPYRADFEEQLQALGFDLTVAEEPHEVEANMGFKRGHEAPTVPTTEKVAFEALVYHAVKRR